MCRSGRSKRLPQPGGFAGFTPVPKPLSDLDQQMFYYADASCEFYCSVSGHPRYGARGRRGEGQTRRYSS